MNINLEIRPYRPDDKSRLLNIWRAASAVGHPFFTEDQLDQQADAVRDVYLPKAENWVAVLDGAPVGFIGLLDQFVGGLFESGGAKVGHGSGGIMLPRAE